MKNQKVYEAEDKMISLIRDNYNVLQSLGSFGISLGFGDRTVREVCEGQRIDTATFLAVVNLAINGHHDVSDVSRLSIPTLMQYLKASHNYYLDFQLPFIRRELVDALDTEASVAQLILRLFDEYARTIQLHMRYEEKNMFPYVEKLMAGKSSTNGDIDTFSKHHGQVGQKLKELKNIIIKYLPSDGLRNNILSATLYDIYNIEEWLAIHARVEDEIFIPAIRLLEEQSRQKDVSAKLSSIIGQGNDNTENLSDREKDVIVCLVQGMSNKEIADHLYISINTVITHRRNIARKLQIRSVAGLTIYAIANNFIDISKLEI